jgi:hypothetical protein
MVTPEEIEGLTAASANPGDQRQRTQRSGRGRPLDLCALCVLWLNPGLISLSATKLAHWRGGSSRGLLRRQPIRDLAELEG